MGSPSHTVDPPASRREVMERFFAYLEEQGITYALLGDPSDAFSDSRDNDYDLVVRQPDLDAGYRWLSEFCRRNGARLVQCLQHEATGFYYVLAMPLVDHVAFLKIDLCSEYLRQGRRLLTCDLLLRDRRKATGGIWIPAPSTAFIYYLIKKVDKTEAFTGFDYLRRSFLEDEEGGLNALNAFFPRYAAAAAKALRGGQPDFFAQHQSALRQVLPGSWRAGVGYGRGEWARRWRRITRPTGVVVALLGPDGSGKSTVLKRLMEQMRPAFRRTETYHLRPPLRRSVGTSVPVTDPHAQPPRGLLMSLVKLGYWWLEYVAGYLIHIAPARIRSTLIVFDRYYDDLLIDPKRYRWGSSMVWARWVRKGIPRPDLVYVLLAEPHILLARKQEVTREELERQLQAYRMWADQNGYVIVDASAPPAEVARVMGDHLLRHLEQRLSRRMERRS
jgi:thymidylate kinase